MLKCSKDYAEGTAGSTIGYNGGESPADCYDRTCTFLESLMRQVERKRAERVVVVTHSLTIRCFVMRFLHLKVEDFDRMSGLSNGAVVTLARIEQLQSPVFRSGRWGVGDLPLRPTSQSAKSPIITRPPEIDEFTG